MRATYTGEPQIFPDLGPFELVSGSVVELPEGVEDAFLQRPDFEEASDDAKLSELSLPLGPPDDVEEAAVEEEEQEIDGPRTADEIIAAIATVSDEALVGYAADKRVTVKAAAEAEIARRAELPPAEPVVPVQGADVTEEASADTGS